MRLKSAGFWALFSPQPGGLLPSHDPLPPFLIRGIATMADHVRWSGIPHCVCRVGLKHLLNAHDQLLLSIHFWRPLFSFRTDPPCAVSKGAPCMHIYTNGHHHPAHDGVEAGPCVLR